MHANQHELKTSQKESKSNHTGKRSGATTKNQNPPRRHGDTEKVKTQFSPQGTEGHGGELETKSLPQRTQRAAEFAEDLFV